MFDKGLTWRGGLLFTEDVFFFFFSKLFNVSAINIINVTCRTIYDFLLVRCAS